MRNVRVLDCTLRDGGRIIDCAFANQEIKNIVSRLSNAKIDIVEVGFIRDRRKLCYTGNSTFFTDIDQIVPFLDKSNKNTMYTVFIDYGMCDIESLKYNEGTSIDGIRLGFTKKNFDEEKEKLIEWSKIIKERGYKLFIQGVNSLSYTDVELLQVIEMINDIHPYSYGIVDTYGAMYIEDVDRLYRLIDNNLLSDVSINFHSHNNYQLSFAFAQELIRLSAINNRKIIIDGTLSGIGKVAGNLCTELIVDYMIRKLHYDYDLDKLLDCIDDFIEKYSRDYKWGYSVPALMAGIYKSHPNNIIYLTNKFRLTTKDIGKLLSMIEPGLRTRYDYDNIEKLYIEYSSQNIDDKEALKKLNELSCEKDVLILVPGDTLNVYKSKIDAFINANNNHLLIITVNFDCEYNNGISFYGNIKRYENNHNLDNPCIVSSNITAKGKDYTINYHNLINREYKLFDNSTVMLMNLIRKLCFNLLGLMDFQIKRKIILRTHHFKIKDILFTNLIQLTGNLPLQFVILLIQCLEEVRLSLLLQHTMKSILIEMI